MNLFLQTGLGLLPGTAAAIILLFTRRAFNLNKIFLTALLTLACAGLTVSGAAASLSAAAEKPQLSQKNMMTFASALVKEEAYDAAQEVVVQYSETYGYDDECRLLNARIALMEGDYERAACLYHYLCGSTRLVSAEDEEVTLADSQTESGASELALLQYLESVGEDITEYGYTQASYDQLMAGVNAKSADGEQVAREAIEDSYSIPEGASDCASAVADISDTYAELSGDGETFSVRKYQNVFDELEENAEEYLSLDCVSKARIKTDVLAGDYSAIAERVDDSSSYHELMIAAELYMGGLVKKTDFSDEYQEIDQGDADAVIERLNAICQWEEQYLSTPERRSLESQVTAVTRQLSDPVLLTVREQLVQAADEEAGTDATKVYLELAKIANYFGDETSTDAYLNTAIYGSQECEDDDYAAAMSQIISVISNDDDLENIKNVSEYVDTVLDNSLTIDVERILSPQTQGGASGGSGNYGANESDSSGTLQGSTQGDDDTGGEEDVEIADFAQTMVDYVSRAKSSITIGLIDTSDFEKITARVQIDSGVSTDPDELRDVLKIYDCGIEIEDFTIRKLDYTGSNILLLCDVSGSMAYSMGDLRDAVTTFLEGRDVSENISIATFNTGITASEPFGTSQTELEDFARSMYSDGGTDMFSSALSCLETFSVNSGEINVLILLTDGQDNNPKSDEQIYDEIGGLALAKGVTIYTLGLGTDVDTSYLNTIADSGNGSFIYVSDSSSLTSFYDMLHSQVYSQYEITYEARDTIKMSGRTLEVALPDENLRDIRTYSLGVEDDGEEGLDATADLSIYGLSPRSIVKGSRDVTVNLLGMGFSPEDEISVKLNGNIDYTLSAVYVDSGTYELTVPAGTAVGVYNVEVTLGGKKTVLQNGLEVKTQGDEKTTAFGPYVFTSTQKIDSGSGTLTLRGSVTLNGWLHFLGDVTIVGDPETDASIRVSDYSGSYVVYDEATATTIGCYLAEKGLAMEIPALYSFNLYNDWDHLYNNYKNYLVDDITGGTLEVYDLMIFDSPVINLYPNSINMSFTSGSTCLPYQSQILKVTGASSLLPFTFSCQASGQITNETVGVVLDVSLGDEDKKNFNHEINLLNLPVYFNGSLSVKINTVKEEYSLGAMVHLAFFADESGLGADVSWKGNLALDSVKFKVDPTVKIALPTTIPITVDDFSFQVSNIQAAAESGKWTSLKFTGTASFSALSVGQVIPPLSKFLGNDTSLFRMPDTSASLQLSPFTFEADAKLMFLSEIELAEASFKLGTFNYNNVLLDLENTEVQGLMASIRVGVMLDMASGRIKLDLSGASEFDAHSRFVGFSYNGICGVDIDFWMINLEKSVNADADLGFYVTHSGEQQFVFTYKYQNSNGKIKGNYYYLDMNGHAGRTGTLN